MPLTKFIFQPGLVKDDTPLASEGSWTDGDKMRFRQGQPEVIGGWDAATADTFAGIVRGAHAWADFVGRRYLAFGTASQLYAMVGGTLTDITPSHSEGVLTNAFTVAAGSPVVTVAHADHGFASGMAVVFDHQSVAIGGLTLAGVYPVVVVDNDTYTVIAASNAVGTATGGGNVDYIAELPAGAVHGIGEPGGYGSGPYGAGGYGLTDVLDALPRVWFVQNWGETLVAVPRGGGLYQWQPATSYPELMTNGDFSSAGGWTVGVGWSITTGDATAAAGAASSLSRPLVLQEGYVYRVTVDAAVAAGSLTIQTDAGTIGDASAAISVSGSYSRLFRAPPGATRIVFNKDAAFVGAIDNVSVKLESVAYRIDEAPKRNAAMFIDPHQIVVLLGTTPYGGVYNPMALAWSDTQNLTDWVPSVSNLAGDNILAEGSRLVAGIATRQQNLIWSDAAVYTMQYTGSALDTFRFDLAGTGCGLIGAMAMAEHDGTVYWAARSRNFYQFSGAAPTPIASRIDIDVFDNIAANQDEKVACGILPSQSEVWFLLPDGRDGNECSRYATYRWDEGHWTAGTFARSAFIAPGIYEYPVMFGTDGRVYWHEKGETANGGVITAFLESAYFDIGDGEARMMIRRIVGDFKSLSGYVDILLTGRRWPTGTELQFGPYRHTSGTEKIDCRVTAREIKLRLDSTAAPLSWRLGALALDIMPTGIRR